MGRFNAIDLLTEQHYDYTGYHYTFNNPINYIDILGLDTVPANNDNNKDLYDYPPLWFSVEWEWKFWGAGAKAEAGPLKIGAEASVVNVTGKAKMDGESSVSLEGKFVNGEVEGQVGKLAYGKAEGSVAEGSVTANENLNVDVEGKLLTGSLEGGSKATQSKTTKSGSVVPKSSSTANNNNPYGSDLNNWNVGGTVKIGPAKIKAGTNPAAAGPWVMWGLNDWQKIKQGQSPPGILYMLFGGSKKK